MIWGFYLKHALFMLKVINVQKGAKILNRVFKTIYLLTFCYEFWSIVVKFSCFWSILVEFSRIWLILVVRDRFCNELNLTPLRVWTLWSWIGKRQSWLDDGGDLVGRVEIRRIEGGSCHAPKNWQHEMEREVNFK